LNYTQASKIMYKNMDCFCFVILHYQTKADTSECVDSILKNIVYPKLKIIIVDNGSPNRSGSELEELFKGNDNIEVLLSPENLGFTGGNNIGFMYAKNQCNADFIALINNDTIIEQKDFVDTIINKFKNAPFHILGPDIVTLAGRHQNPVFNKLSSLKAVQNYIKHYQKVLFLNYLGLDIILEKTKKFFSPESKIHIEDIKKSIDHSSEQQGIALHGSAIVFSGLYIKKYDGLYPGPFMYGEEAILDYFVKKDNLISVYFPGVRILHKDDSSTNSVYRKALKKRRFYLKNFMRSLKVLENLFNEGK
jgi:GT2 family glycosyltransferase